MTYEGFDYFAPAGVGQKNEPARPRPIDGAPAHTITGAGNGYIFDSAHGARQIQHGGSGRILTHAESGALQGFPPDYPWTATVNVSKTKRRQIGNAVNPQVAEAVLRSLIPPELLK